MNYFEITIIALALSTDALAVSIVLGLGMERATFKKALIVALYFGLFQALMPLIGFFVATLFASTVQAVAHWIAFGLLLALGAKMLFGVIIEKRNSTKQKKERIKTQKSEENIMLIGEGHCKKQTSLRPVKMIPYALATSVDALAVGVSFALLYVNIFSAVAIIGAITFVLSVLAVKLGSLLGLRIKSKAEIIGGIILILLAANILLGHFGLLPF